MTIELRFKYLLYLATLASTWIASSRVGVRMSARIRLPRSLRSTLNFSNIGSTKLAVLPVPVCAAATKSLPDKK